MIDLLFALVVWAIAIAIVWWIVQSIPIPPPFRWIATAVIGLLALIALFSLAGGHGLSLR